MVNSRFHRCVLKNWAQGSSDTPSEPLLCPCKQSSPCQMPCRRLCTTLHLAGTPRGCSNCAEQGSMLCCKQNRVIYNTKEKKKCICPRLVSGHGSDCQSIFAASYGVFQTRTQSFPSMRPRDCHRSKGWTVTRFWVLDELEPAEGSPGLRHLDPADLSDCTSEPRPPSTTAVRFNTGCSLWAALW